MNIAEAAKYTGLSSKTIRYYEQEKIIPPAKRGDNGYRQYDADQLALLVFIKRARDLGFSLSDSHELLLLSLDPERSSAVVKQKAVQHLNKVNDQIMQLQKMRDILEGVVGLCSGDSRAECPILDKLSGASQ
ncbi:Cu(I)-responsive transcriptional regulator [Neptunomonas antarctica]|uniref:Transcriptional regulator, MerR family n=1 Tax=Neptunomonas antarctica TaxID=619304 RepID=A0A1N7K8D2_9GAMM|nr:Cu(I)-responsive transcriptional regulator [Neptunomonas antarctica]SIS57832.1 transcriptional regulator, MerR family [Neptunomonas antarctica]